MGPCRKTSWVADQHLLGFRKELLGLWTHASILHGNVCCLLKGPRWATIWWVHGGAWIHISYIVIHCHTNRCDLPEPHFLGPTECSKAAPWRCEDSHGWGTSHAAGRPPRQSHAAWEAALSHSPQETSKNTHIQLAYQQAVGFFHVFSCVFMFSWFFKVLLDPQTSKNIATQASPPFTHRRQPGNQGAWKNGVQSMYSMTSSIGWSCICGTKRRLEEHIITVVIAIPMDIHRSSQIYPDPRFQMSLMARFPTKFLRATVGGGSWPFQPCRTADLHPALPRHHVFPPSIGLGGSLLQSREGFLACAWHRDRCDLRWCKEY